MAHPTSLLKHTEHVNFGKSLHGIPKNSAAATAVHDLTRRRQAFENACEHADNCSQTMMNAIVGYLEMPIEEIIKQAEDKSHLRFKWNSVTSEDRQFISHSPLVDQASVIFSAALWLRKHAQTVMKSTKNLSDKDEDLNMKDCLESLKTASGLFDYLENHPQPEQLDLTSYVASALSLQCLAEGQMLIIKRAVKKGHNSTLLSQLCHDVSIKLASAVNQIKQINASDGHLLEKWIFFLKHQEELYMALARCYQGVDLLESQERCGDSVAALKLSSKHIENARLFSKEYDHTKPKTSIKMHYNSEDYVEAKKLVQLHKEKGERENSMVFYQKIPENAPDLETAKCLVAAHRFTPPQVNRLEPRIPEEEGESKQSPG